MERFDAALSDMDLAFFGAGEHAISAEGAAKLIGNDNVYFLDVRTTEENELVSFPFAHHIPVNELPARLNELPTDKLVIVFCSTIFRGAMVYGYLLGKGFEQVKAMAGAMEQLTAQLKPHPIHARKA